MTVQNSKTKHAFPDDVVLVKLLAAAHADTSGKPVIYDANGSEKAYMHLLGDVLRLRDVMRCQLPSSAFDDQGLLRQDSPYVCVLATSGYEFLVAFFATRVLGGALISLASVVLVEETLHFISDANAICLLQGVGLADKCQQIKSYVGDKGRAITTVPISTDANPVNPLDVTLDESLPLDPQGPGFVVYTSGTTGIPKGVVLSRLTFTTYDLAESGSVTISFRPTHWLGGASSLIGPMLTGMKVHVLPEMAGPELFWETLKRRRITYLSFNPTILRRMKEYYIDVIEHLPDETRREYLDGLRHLSRISCSSAMIAPSTLKFWKTLTGLPFENLYGATEVGALALRGIDCKVRNSIGHPIPAVKTKLSDGDRGELLVKNPAMFTHYLNNPEATRLAFDADGYVKTGDLMQIVDGEYVFCGRTSTDFILFYGCRIPALRVETALTDLPYISDAHVLGVPDHEARELCGAVVRLRKGADQSSGSVSLARIRDDLSGSLPTYMLPLLLHILGDDEQVPHTVSQKPIKRRMRKMFFGVDDFWSPELPSPGVEFWDDFSDQVKGEARPWDWSGLQRAT
ncbi:hypothetical protein HIM_08327 [Hirsutella minnesotensis 3608]|uniref:AMP-dependent synthetase/ligase domain-containing protein n=1 Tax=Hirsutella minnesotensis 3608 TaxID=1043627 RepID=A0A0F7ZHA2_9HYPO|nr:hypothetical protein HIM_08327 [Hirsutella minnesotensis 3608]